MKDRIEQQKVLLKYCEDCPYFTMRLEKFSFVQKDEPFCLGYSLHIAYVLRILLTNNNIFKFISVCPKKHNEYERNPNITVKEFYN